MVGVGAWRCHARRPGPYGRLVKVVTAGGSGTLGRALSAELARRGHEVVVPTRRLGAQVQLGPAGPPGQVNRSPARVGATAGGLLCLLVSSCTC